MALPIDVERLGTDLPLPVDPDDELRPTPTGDIPVVFGRGNLKAALIRRMLTMPGALLHRPGYGAGAPGYVDTIGQPATRSKAANAIRRNLLSDPRLADCSVTVAAGLPSDARRPGMTVGLSVRLRDEEATEQMTVSYAE